MAQILREVTVAPVMLRCYGRVTPSTRLVANVGKPYRYPSASLTSGDWTPTLAGLRDKLSVVIGVEPNECLVSYYPDGTARVGWWHRDGGGCGARPSSRSRLGSVAASTCGVRRVTSGDGSLAPATCSSSEGTRRPGSTEFRGASTPVLACRSRSGCSRGRSGTARRVRLRCRLAAVLVGQVGQPTRMAPWGLGSDGPLGLPAR